MRKFLVVLILMIGVTVAAPRYMVKLQLKQSHISLSIMKHAKDALNKIEFSIPVDKQFYNSVKVNDLLIDNWRGGSFFISGSMGKWKIKVMDKRIIND